MLFSVLRLVSCYEIDTQFKAEPSAATAVARVLPYATFRLVRCFEFFTQCKCDFCWVCLENWKKHSSATGGYFRCNRFEAVHKADEKQGLLISEVGAVLDH